MIPGSIALLLLFLVEMADAFYFCLRPPLKLFSFGEGRPATHLYSLGDEKRAIGDVVQGLHGSKYQFSDAGINLEGQQFAEMSYSSGEILEQNVEKDPIPSWARQMLDLPLPLNAPELMVQPGHTTNVSIQNNERSWEMFYAFVVGPSSSTTKVQPWVGQLAPRGGANQFSDRMMLNIQSSDVREDSWIVLGTEAEKWFYKLVAV